MFSKPDCLTRSLAPLLPAPHPTTTTKLSPNVTDLKLSGDGIPDETSQDFVWKLDRLGRSVKDVLTIADDLHERGVGVRILTGKLSGTYSPAGEGKFFFTMMAAFAELERDIIHERTMAGLVAARAQGRRGGRRLMRWRSAEHRTRLHRESAPARVAIPPGPEGPRFLATSADPVVRYATGLAGP